MAAKHKDHSSKEEDGHLSHRSETASEHQERNWSRGQAMIARVLRAWPTEVALTALIGISFILVIVETDSYGEPPDWLGTVNLVLLSIYTVEVLIRIFVFRLFFFHSMFNIIDLLVVLIDLVSTTMELVAANTLPSLTVLRVFRLLRLARSYKVMVQFPQLAQLVKGLVNAVSAVCYGGVLLFLIITIWSVVAVQLIHPVSKRLGESGGFQGCDRCARSFATVKDSMLTFTQQIVAGDSWGQVTIPIIEAAPETAWFFGAVFVTVNLTIINVMLAVIVDTAQKAGQEDAASIAQAKAEEYERAANKLRRICKAIDADGSGDLTEEELIEGIDTRKDFHDHLLAMDIKKEDMHLVFSILDNDGSGTVQYDEFVTELFKMKQHDSHTMLVFIKHYVTEIRKGMEEQIHLLKNELMQKFSEAQAASVQAVEKKSSCEFLDKQEPLAAVPKSSSLLEEKRLPRGQGEPSDDLRAELQRISNVISEDLVRNLQSVAEQSAAHTRLLTTMLGDVPATRGSGPARGGGDVKGGALLAPLMLPDTRSSGLPGGATNAALLHHPDPSLQVNASSAWATSCCGVRRPDASGINGATLVDVSRPNASSRGGGGLQP